MGPWALMPFTEKPPRPPGPDVDPSTPEGRKIYADFYARLMAYLARMGAAIT